MEEKRKLALKGAEEPTGDFAEEAKELKEEKKEHNPAVRDPKDQKDKVGRNDPCPCGSGKKYKKCHGK